MGGFRSGRNIQRTIRKPRRVLKKFPRDDRLHFSRARPGQAGGNLVPRRSPRRSAGLADAYLGEAWLKAARAARSAPRMGLYLRGGLSGTGGGGRSRPAERQHRGIFPSFG